jgi:hypothetical protein
MPQGTRIATSADTVFDGIQRNHFTGDADGFFGGGGDDVGGAAGFDTAFGEGLAFFAADGSRQVFDAGAHQPGGLVKNLRAAERRQLLHRRGAGLERGEGGDDVGRIGVRDGVEHAAIERTDDLEGGLFVAPLA